MNTFPIRLSQAMELRDKKAIDLAKETGISRGTISNYLKGGFTAKQVNTDKLAKCLNINVAWLLGADVSMEIPKEEITPNNIIKLKSKKIPLLGTIAAGVPILAEENIEDYIDVEAFTKADFCLKIQGDSMINAGIKDKDIVFVKSQSDVEDGEIAAVLIEGHSDYSTTATLKRVYHYEDSIQLISENPIYKPITLSKINCQSVNIIGKVTHVLTPVK